MNRLQLVKYLKKCNPNTEHHDIPYLFFIQDVLSSNKFNPCTLNNTEDAEVMRTGFARKIDKCFFHTQCTV